ncbi:MAG: ABC transporter permease [Paracoccaceae bacterium]|nr:ABC transporter permease [Paracoccaceae bacterium]
MIRRILALSSAEFTIALRNRWVLIATLMMALFSVVLTFAGSAPTGALGVDHLTVAVASMTTLSVYLVPLLALLLSFDAVAGEIERGGLALLLTYPVSRFEVLLGKMCAHLAVLALAVGIGFGLSGLLTWAVGGSSAASLLSLGNLVWSAILLGATFLAVGYAASTLAKSSGAAAGLAIGIWIVFVVIYDLALLGALVADKDGVFTSQVFPIALVANPADAFRVFNLANSESVALATGLGGTGKSISLFAILGSMFVWPVAAMALARFLMRRVEP